MKSKGSVMDCLPYFELYQYLKGISKLLTHIFCCLITEMGGRFPVSVNRLQCGSGPCCQKPTLYWLTDPYQN